MRTWFRPIRWGAAALAVCLGTAAPGAAAQVPLKDVAVGHGLAAPAENGRRVVLRSAYSTLAFEPNTRRLFYNDLLIYLNAPVLGGSGRWTVAECDAKSVIGALLRRDQALASSGCGTIVLDPGHGGEDSGTLTRHGVAEKKLVLDIARRVASKLEGCGVTVYLTRDRDRFVTLEERSRIAGYVHGDLFVSIHANASRDPAVSGLETFVTPAQGFPSTTSDEPGRLGQTAHAGNRFEAENLLLAYYLHRGLVSYAAGGDRGIKRARYQVLRDAPCPAALVECGFLSNRTEADKLDSRSYRDLVADALARGIMTYVSNVNEARYGQHYACVVK